MLTGRYRPTRTNIASKANGFGLRDTRLFKLPSLNQHCRILLPDKFWHNHGPRCFAARIACWYPFSVWRHNMLAAQCVTSTDENCFVLCCAVCVLLQHAKEFVIDGLRGILRKMAIEALMYRDGRLIAKPCKMGDSNGGLESSQSKASEK